MKVIFLDCDGVLNWSGTEDRIGGYIGLCPKRIARFNKIVEAVPEAKIVISSTWRKGMSGVYNDIPGLIALWQSRGIKGDFIGYTPIRFGYRSRGAEIREWIEDYEEENGPLDTFVILDDDTDGMMGGSFKQYVGLDDLGDDVYKTVYPRDLRFNHVVTDWTGFGVDGEEGGLQDSHVEAAIKILKGE